MPNQITVTEARRRVQEYKIERDANRKRSTGFQKNVEAAILAGIDREDPHKVYHIDELAAFCVMGDYGPGAVGPATSYMVDDSGTLERVGKGKYRKTPRRR